MSSSWRIRTPERLDSENFAAVVVAYAFSPIDLIPDFIPVLGYLDDLLLVPLGVALALKMIPEEVLVDARAEVDTAFPDGKPKNWVAGAIIVAIWVVTLALVMLWMVRWIGNLKAGLARALLLGNSGYGRWGNFQTSKFLIAQF